MNSAEDIACWAASHPLTPIHVDCVTTVMLKILDGKCKMSPQGMRSMAWLYDRVRDQPGELLDTRLHALIERARAGLDDEMVMQVYEARLLAETTISRPVMKAFKAMLRAEGLLASGVAV